MNLCIDQGNSRTKLAIFSDGEMVNNFIYKKFDAEEIVKICSLYPVENSIISSVVNIDPAIVNTLNRLSKRFILFDHNTPVPLQNLYGSPQTLGQDRLAAAVGANGLSPDKNLLIIDAGSAITYDFVNADNQYIGGNIAPGLKMRFTALKNQTKKLPLVEIGEKQIIPLFGTSFCSYVTSENVIGFFGLMKLIALLKSVPARPVRSLNPNVLNASAIAPTNAAERMQGLLFCM